MAEVPKQDAVPPGPQYEPPKPPPKQNPALRMLGLPNWRLRLPSRNWMIFLSITGSFTAAVMYDRRQKKAVQKKWCDLVADIAQRPLPVSQMPRKLTIFLSAPPGDGIGHSRKYFKEYVKPVLVAAAMDYEVIEGRKEGDVRYGTAESIRRLRRKLGEKGASTEDEEEMDTEQTIDQVREKMHVQPEPGLRGDLILGRHTWKEYVRGLHEGWLGPLDEPPEPTLELEPSPINTTAEALTDNPGSSGPIPETELKKEEEKKEEKKKPTPPPSYLAVSQYSSAPLSPHTPAILEPSNAIHQEHLLGFLKTPQRIWNFLNRRSLADETGRQAAAIVLAAYRPYHSDEAFVSTSSGVNDDASPVATRAPENDAEVIQISHGWEQQTPLIEEERLWHKSARKPKKVDDKSERIWMQEIVLDPRIAERMRKFELDPEEEARANRIARGEETTRARKLDDLRSEPVQVEKFD